MNIQFNLKPSNVFVLTNKSQWISKLNQKIQRIRWMKHIEYPTFAHILIETIN
jgi:metal-responsive CopG/Arc/MetJ family transcriptional regulator